MWASLAALIGSELLKKFTFETAKYVALRLFLIALVIGLGPVAIMWGYTRILEHVLGYASNYVGGLGLEGTEVSITGFAGWMASHLRIGEGISILLSFSLLSFTLKTIRVK